MARESKSVPLSNKTGYVGYYYEPKLIPSICASMFEDVEEFVELAAEPKEVLFALVVEEV